LARQVVPAEGVTGPNTASKNRQGMANSMRQFTGSAISGSARCGIEWYIPT
jgi:hypothetical protein